MNLLPSDAMNRPLTVSELIQLLLNQHDPNARVEVVAECSYCSAVPPTRLSVVNVRSRLGVVELEGREKRNL